MRALILAAGRGSRMGSRTEEQPKCLTRLAGKPLFDWQREALIQAGIGEIAVVSGYRSEKLAFPGIRRFENERWAQTNMVASLLVADAWMKIEPCIVSYSDIVYSGDAVKKLIECPGDIAIAFDPSWHSLWSLRFSDPLDDAETFRLDSEGNVVDIGRKTRSLDEIRGQYMGLLKFTPQGWRQIQSYLAQKQQAEVDRLDMTSLLRGLIESGARIRAAAISDRWYEVDNENDLKKYEELFAKRGGSVF